MNTYNQYFNTSWEYLEQYHKPTSNKAGRKWDGFAYKFTLDMTIKPSIAKSEYPTYINHIVNVLVVGRRENLLAIHVDGACRQVYWTVDNS